MMVSFRPHYPCSATRHSQSGDASATSSASMRSFLKNMDQMDSLYLPRQRRASWVDSFSSYYLSSCKSKSNLQLWKQHIFLHRYDKGEGRKGRFLICRLCWEKKRCFGEVRVNKYCKGFFLNTLLCLYKQESEFSFHHFPTGQVSPEGG